MIRVLNFSSDHNIGGAGRCILTFLEHYDRENFQVAVALPEASALIPFIEALDTQYIEIQGFKDKSFSLKGIVEAYKTIKKYKPDIVHCHASFSARIASKLCRIPVVYTRHSVFPNSRLISKGLGKAVNGFVNNFSADKIIAVASAAKDNLTDAGISDKKIVVIKNGVKPIQKFSDAEIIKIKEKYGIQNQFIFSMIARVEDIKGHLYFVEAASEFVRRNKNVKFIICGTGNYIETVKNKVNELNLNDYFIFTGYLSDVTEIVNITDVNVNCSYGTEATSLSLLEGMSIGKPIIASDYGGNIELVEPKKNGLLFKTKDSLSLYNQMINLSSDNELYNDLSEGAEKLYKEKYTAKIYAHNIEKIYNELNEERNK